MVDRLAKIFSSLRLTVVLLGAGLLLVFIGTLAQVDEGLYMAQTRYFKSWFIWAPTMFGKVIPILFPGGYLIGSLLLINLLAAHIKRFQLTKKKIGIHLIHGGLILLLLGQLLTDAFSTESAMRLAEGEAKNYSQDFHDNELVLIETSNPKQDEVIAIPENLVASGKEIRHPKLPMTLRIKQYWPNSELFDNTAKGSVPSGATQGAGAGLYVVPVATTTSSEERNMPSALVEVLGPKGSLGTWLATSWLSAPQEVFAEGGKSYKLALRFARHYKPFSLKLEEFTHERYRGTDIPKNFASRVRIQRPESGEDREVLIFMNNPLRYNGETYYQAGFDEHNDTLLHKVTILQVVHNPSWLTPYFSCCLVALGLVVQFLSHLIGFARKQRTA